jgi:hypothetical protein
MAPSHLICRYSIVVTTNDVYVQTIFFSEHKKTTYKIVLRKVESPVVNIDPTTN